MFYPYELTGASGVVRDTVAQVERAALDDRGVLIIAGRGLDAESVGRALHGLSARASSPFVVMVCDGLRPRELDRGLFGGPARPGADVEVVSPASALGRARGGALFLQNVNELPATLQRRLARVVRDGEIRAPRRSAVLALDVRLIASVGQAPDDTLRDELLRRMPVRIDVPPLGARRDDVPAIAEAMLASHARGRRFTPAALTVLAALPWRRNVAELSALVARLAGPGRGALIRQEDVLAEVQFERAPARRGVTLKEARRQFEKDYIASVLREHAWQMRDAAHALGIERANLYRKARQLGIALQRGASPAERSVR